MNADRLCREIDKLLGTDFFETSYGKHHALMRLPEAQTENLFTDSQVEAFIRFNEMKERSPKVFFHGHRVRLDNAPDHSKQKYDHIMRLHNGGASVICNQTQTISKNIRHLTSFLEQKFEAKTHGNLYITPAKMTAFNPHYDRHDVLVIQLRGSKKWSFYAPHKSEDGKHTFEKNSLEKTEERILTQGDLLYVPHGLIHAAESTNETSWHITLGMAGYYWKDALKDLIDNAAGPYNLNLLNRLPLKGGTSDQLQNKAGALFEMMKSQIDFSKGLEKFKAEYPDMGLSDSTEPLHAFIEPEAIDDHQFFSFIDLSELTIQTSEERLSLSVTGRKRKLHLKTSLLDLITRMKVSSQFSPASVSGEESIRDVKLFFSFLMENGFIKIATV